MLLPFFIPVDLKLVMKIIVLGPVEQKHSTTPTFPLTPPLLLTTADILGLCYVIMLR